MLVFQIRFLEGDFAEFFGFWYGRQKNPPRTREEKRAVLDDLEAGQSREIILAGTSKQIEDLLFSLQWEGAIRDTANPTMEKAIQRVKTNPLEGAAFDNLLSPKGTLVRMDANVRLTAPVSSVIAELYSECDIVRLELAPDWRVGEDC